MTQNNAGGSAKDAADQNFDYMFKLLIIGNSSVGKTSFVNIWLSRHETNDEVRENSLSAISLRWWFIHFGIRQHCWNRFQGEDSISSR